MCVNTCKLHIEVVKGKAEWSFFIIKAIILFASQLREETKAKRAHTLPDVMYSRCYKMVPILKSSNPEQVDLIMGIREQ